MKDFSEHNKNKQRLILNIDQSSTCFSLIFHPLKVANIQAETGINTPDKNCHNCMTNLLKNLSLPSDVG